MSMTSLKLMTKKTWKDANKIKLVTPQDIDQHKDLKARNKDIIIKPSDEEVKILNDELDKVNSSCSTRLQPIVVEEKELDRNNKRKKNRSNTTYRMKFRATNPTELTPKRKGASPLNK
ncbi:hypothetical protein RclHR1_07660002 [Rhizophagus clarus]|uniref:Uncharacterized protein n=1 Tax=Rhizophagus clarus TaxID=94130 RepID=A0A2Z6RXK4_9GLOM|nr:hypothetical protein RclHR1_07660002 [Rhizophagus clarus]GES99128.1 hypothetical protein RCL_jg9248.t1 [Rhizophagus clarus]